MIIKRTINTGKTSVDISIELTRQELMKAYCEEQYLTDEEEYIYAANDIINDLLDDEEENAEKIQTIKDILNDEKTIRTNVEWVRTRIDDNYSYMEDYSNAFYRAIYDEIDY